MSEEKSKLELSFEEARAKIREHIEDARNAAEYNLALAAELAKQYNVDVWVVEDCWYKPLDRWLSSMSC